MNRRTTSEEIETRRVEALAARQDRCHALRKIRGAGDVRVHELRAIAEYGGRKVETDVSKWRCHWYHSVCFALLSAI
jgi:hypothetical protein